MEVGGKDVELGMEGRRKGDCRHIGEDGLYEGEREKDVMSEPRCQPGVRNWWLN